MATSFKVACLLAVIAVAVCNLGGYQDIADTNSAIVDQASRMATQSLQSNNAACPAGLHRISAQEQLVNGKNYKFTFTVDPAQCGSQGPVQTCEVVVYVSIDESQKTISSSRCQ